MENKFYISLLINFICGVNGLFSLGLLRILSEFTITEILFLRFFTVLVLSYIYGKIKGVAISSGDNLHILRAVVSIFGFLCYFFTCRISGIKAESSSYIIPLVTYVMTTVIAGHFITLELGLLIIIFGASLWIELQKESWAFKLAYLGGIIFFSCSEVIIGQIRKKKTFNLVDALVNCSLWITIFLLPWSWGLVAKISYFNIYSGFFLLLLGLGDIVCQVLLFESMKSVSKKQNLWGRYIGMTLYIILYKTFIEYSTQDMGLSLVVFFFSSIFSLFWKGC